MKFQIERTSDAYEEYPRPVPEAVREGKTQYGNTRWTIEIKSLDALMALSVATQKPLVVNRKDDDEGPYPTIEIYDDWRE